MATTGELYASNTVADTRISLKINSAALIDTTSDVYGGYLIIPTYESTTITAQQISFNSDDAATASEHPDLKVYFKNVKVMGTPAAGTTPKGKRRRLMQLGEMDTITNICQYEEKER
jgi:hypothetical protein